MPEAARKIPPPLCIGTFSTASIDPLLGRDAYGAATIAMPQILHDRFLHAASQTGFLLSGCRNLACCGKQGHRMQLEKGLYHVGLCKADHWCFAKRFGPTLRRGVHMHRCAKQQLRKQATLFGGELMQGRLLCCRQRALLESDNLRRGSTAWWRVQRAGFSKHSAKARTAISAQTAAQPFEFLL